jgi:pimeloyl-ACP methyl ester carboxylesterase
MAPNTRDFGSGLPFLTRLAYTPVLGQAMWRLTPDSVVRSSYEESVAPDFDLSSGFDDPDQVVSDFRAMTYTSFDDAHTASDDFLDELPLDERFKRVLVPLMVIFGAEDQIFDAEQAIEGFADVPGVKTELVEGAGHAPQIEKPEEVAALLEEFSVDVAPAEPNRNRAQGGKRDRQRPNARGQDSKKDRQQ